MDATLETFTDSCCGTTITTKQQAKLRNSAFVFVKPHANLMVVQDKVREMLKEAKVEIKNEGDITGPTIDQKKLIDQHYYAIASKATLLHAKDIAVPAKKFEDFFREKWEAVLAADRACNAMQACERFGIDGKELEEIWRACEKNNKVIKFGGGFYCGLINTSMNVMHGIDGLYVFNAFFMNMRSRFTGENDTIHYYQVDWAADDLSWAEFRGQTLGPTDPTAAPVGSIRRFIYDEWQALGLHQEPSKGNNGVHASASPLEGLAEKCNWMEQDIVNDEFGKSLLDNGITLDTIKAWSVDPRVTLPGGDEKGSIFDALEDMDADACLEKCIAINKVAESTAAAPTVVEGASSF